MVMAVFMVGYDMVFGMEMKVIIVMVALGMMCLWW